VTASGVAEPSGWTPSGDRPPRSRLRCEATEDATATLLSMSGADFLWTMHDHGLPPGTITASDQPAR
jgi:hypothetical protein